MRCAPTSRCCRKRKDWAHVVSGPIEPVIGDEEFAAKAAALLPSGAYDETTWSAFVNSVKAETGAKGKALFMPLRQALTGRDHGPEMGALFALIGEEKARARLSGKTCLIDIHSCEYDRLHGMPSVLQGSVVESLGLPSGGLARQLDVSDRSVSRWDVSHAVGVAPRRYRAYDQGSPQMLRSRIASPGVFCAVPMMFGEDLCDSLSFRGLRGVAELECCGFSGCRLGDSDGGLQYDKSSMSFGKYL